MGIGIIYHEFKNNIGSEEWVDKMCNYLGLPTTDYSAYDAETLKESLLRRSLHFREDIASADSPYYYSKNELKKGYKEAKKELKKLKDKGYISNSDYNLLNDKIYNLRDFYSLNEAATNRAALQEISKYLREYPSIANKSDISYNKINYRIDDIITRSKYVRSKIRKFELSQGRSRASLLADVRIRIKANNLLRLPTSNVMSTMKEHADDMFVRTR